MSKKILDNSVRRMSVCMYVCITLFYYILLLINYFFYFFISGVEMEGFLV